MIIKINKDIIGSMMDAESAIAETAVTAMLKNSNHFRFQLHLPNELAAMDNSSDSNLNALLEAAEKSKESSLEKLLFGIGIKGIGEKNAKLLAKKYLNIDCCPSARKPRKAKFIKVLKEYKLDLSEVAIIGDQLVTDIYGGNRVGITTVLVNPMSDIDMPFTKIHRYIERKEINKMNKKGIFKVGEYYD